ncbi:MAG: single-stranded DNA-binding protein [Sulfolobales archaeon]
MKHEMESSKVNVIDLKPGMEDVHVVVRVLNVSNPKVIRTKAGERTISEALVGDSTGKVKLTLWGRVAGTVNEGEVVEVIGGWTSVFRNEVQLNVGGRGKINKVDSSLAPESSEIPDVMPKAPERGGEGFRRPPPRGGRGRSRGWR